jgi:hypothetical protein
MEAKSSASATSDESRPRALVEAGPSRPQTLCSVASHRGSPMPLVALPSIATEKLTKAYLWLSGHAPPKSHTGFVRFLKALLDRRVDLDRIAKTLGFRRHEDLDHWVRNIRDLAYCLQNIAPAEAGNGPNPEYPWPHEAPVQCPIDHTFVLWNQLTNTGKGRKLMEFVDRAITCFNDYA